MVPHGTESKLSHPYFGETTSSKCCCFTSEVFGGTFCLEARDGDLWVFYCREIPEGEPIAPSARQIFSGILDAVGFMNACCPWPYYLEHRQDYMVKERWLDATKDCNRDALPPMSKGRLHFGADAQTLFRQAAEFFSGKTEESELFTRSLWLMREACRKGMPFEIRLAARYCWYRQTTFIRLPESVSMKTEHVRSRSSNVSGASKPWIIRSCSRSIPSGGV